MTYKEEKGEAMKYSIYECEPCARRYVVAMGTTLECSKCLATDRKKICSFDNIAALTTYIFTFLPLILEHLKESSLEIEWMGSCTNCGVGEATDEPHPCPLAEEVKGDHSDKCCCCKACTDDCAMSI